MTRYWLLAIALLMVTAGQVAKADEDSYDAAIKRYQKAIEQSQALIDGENDKVAKAKKELERLRKDFGSLLAKGREITDFDDTGKIKPDELGFANVKLGKEVEFQRTAPQIARDLARLHREVAAAEKTVASEAEKIDKEGIAQARARIAEIQRQIDAQKAAKTAAIERPGRQMEADLDYILTSKWGLSSSFNSFHRNANNVKDEIQKLRQTLDQSLMGAYVRNVAEAFANSAEICSAIQYCPKRTTRDGKPAPNVNLDKLFYKTDGTLGQKEGEGSYDNDKYGKVNGERVPVSKEIKDRFEHAN